MASNMIWAHELVHFLNMGHFNSLAFYIGIILSISVSILLLRKQLLVDDKQWLKRMISHHSTALTTSNKIVKNRLIKKLTILIYKLSDAVITYSTNTKSYLSKFLNKKK